MCKHSNGPIPNKINNKCKWIFREVSRPNIINFKISMFISYYKFFCFFFHVFLIILKGGILIIVTILIKKYITSYYKSSTDLYSKVPSSFQIYVSGSFPFCHLSLWYYPFIIKSMRNHRKTKERWKRNVEIERMKGRKDEGGKGR